MTLKTCLLILAVLGMLAIHKVVPSEVEMDDDDDVVQPTNGTNLNVEKGKCISGFRKGTLKNFFFLFLLFIHTQNKFRLVSISCVD